MQPGVPSCRLRLAHGFVRLVVTAVAIAIACDDDDSQRSTRNIQIVSSFQAGEGRPNGVIQARDGQFYGTTQGVGTGSLGPVTIGTVFAIDAAGGRTTLHTFTRFLWAAPHLRRHTGVAPARGADGNLYGHLHSTPLSPIAPGQIFRLTPAGVFTRLVVPTRFEQDSFERVTDDCTERRTARIALVSDRGDVYRVEANDALTVVHEFDGTDIAYPVAELVEADNGHLYGTTLGGRCCQEISSYVSRSHLSASMRSPSLRDLLSLH